MAQISQSQRKNNSAFYQDFAVFKRVVILSSRRSYELNFAFANNVFECYLGASRVPLLFFLIVEGSIRKIASFLIDGIKISKPYFFQVFVFTNR